MTMSALLLSTPPLLTATLPALPVAQPARWGGRWPVILLLSLLVVAGVAAAAWWSLRATAAVHYTTVPATRGLVARTVSATGTVNPELTIIVGSYVSGVIQSLSCDYNTKVKAGQVCARIDPRPYQSLVDQAKANLDIAKAQLEKDKANLVYAKINSERRQSLVARESESKDVADLAKNAYDQALAQIGLDQATIELRQAALDSATVNLGYADIVSPVDGTVVSRISPGEYIQLGRQGSRRVGEVEAVPGLAANADVSSPAGFKLAHSRPGTVSLSISADNDEDPVVRDKPGYRCGAASCESAACQAPKHQRQEPRRQGCARWLSPACTQAPPPQTATTLCAGRSSSS